jgi:hypothetical protein
MNVTAAIPATLPRTVTDVADGKVFALGASVQAERCRAWIARDVNGWIPFQCYVLRDAGKLIMLDGGLPVIRDAVRDGLAALTPGARERRFMMTRRELDTILNLPWIVHDFEFDSAHCGGDLSPIDFFEIIDDASIDAQIRTLMEAPFTFAKPGETTEIGSLRLEMIRASLMVLPTFWFYEAATRTLFTSDCFGVVPQKAPGDPRVVTPSDDDISAERIRAFLDVKFDWLRGIDNRPLARDLEKVFSDRRIDRICPNLGCIIEGRGAVDRLLEQTLKALAGMANEPWRSVLAGWTYQPPALRP